MFGASVLEQFYWLFALFNTEAHRNARVAGNCFLFASSEGCIVTGICWRGFLFFFLERDMKFDVETDPGEPWKFCGKFCCHADKQAKIPNTSWRPRAPAARFIIRCFWCGC